MAGQYSNAPRELPSSGALLYLCLVACPLTRWEGCISLVEKPL
jgi:hypothetical protein